ncbi:MAG TPA: 2,3-bisphosphoglycerate-independent phosphoglycerate mutase [Candidatus Eisenbacteria bacterium]|nr:2,3-bisphosphoglycerate-independent phosphoglycerate mutase [Candidatus Eisenbacteria bacterium]
MSEKNRRPVALFVLDGVGINEVKENNAVYSAKTPNLDKYLANWPNTTIKTSGGDVGLPDGQMGNSEVGHMNIGAGRIVYQDLSRISKSIKDQSFFQNEILLEAINYAKKNNSALHLLGLLSDGGVHSHQEHIYALLEMAKKHGLSKVFIHAFYDGRDVPTTAGVTYTEKLQEKIAEIGLGEIASVSGRYYAMDRDNRWERTKLAYDAVTNLADRIGTDPVEVIKNSYADKVTDEFIIPTTIVNENNEALGPIGPKDSVIFFNFRPDRARQLTRALKQTDFDHFERMVDYSELFYVTMTQYDKEFYAYPNLKIVFEPQNLNNTFGEYISTLGKTQLRIAETEKYPHVTFFFNGGVEKEYPGEDRALLPSPKVATYDLQPEMSAYDITDELMKRLNSDHYDAIICNYANGDMVGHTGVFEAAVTAVEAVDECIGRVVEKILDMGGLAILTADHGNCEQMIDPVTKEIFTAHTTFPVRVVTVGQDQYPLRSGGRLADLAPTMLDLMNLEQPAEMTGESLLDKK